jgi:hypothetical protein
MTPSPTDSAVIERQSRLPLEAGCKLRAETAAGNL